MTPTFEIINASAGSGKTFSLAERVLTNILKSEDEDYFKRILALTFTNKAAQEMKERVLISLKEFSNSKNNKKPSPLFIKVKKKLNFSNEEINRKAKERLNKILHDFSFFQIDTLDSFNHHIIRSFANDLNLSSDFNIITDHEDVIEESVARVFKNNNKDQNALLTEFAIKKISEGKSWDIEHDLKEFAEAIFNENQFKEINEASNNTYEEYKVLKIKLAAKKKSEIDKKKKILEKINVLINSQDFEFKFSRESFPKFLKNVKENDFKWESVLSVSSLFLKQTLLTKGSYNKAPNTAAKFIQQLEIMFLKLKKSLVNISVLNSFENSVTPTALIKTIKKHFKEIQKEKNQISISEFNEIINQEIANQPTPYLYEKLGIRFNNYFIDEFQDTSRLQWANIIPLISHALESNSQDQPGSLFLVGDPKQSVYRWRGADPNIFISLMDKSNPFNIVKNTEGLPKNFRSKEEIVKFNNNFFSTVSSLFTSSNHQKIYKQGSSQLKNEQNGGYVTIKFLRPELKKNEETKEALKEILERIKCCKKRGFNNSEIAILTRDNKQASLVSAGLIERGIPVLSPDSLSINKSEKVKILVNIIKLRKNRSNKIAKFEIANYYASSIKNEDQCVYFKKTIDLGLEDFFNKLEIGDLKNSFNMGMLSAIDFCIKTLKLDEDNTNPFLSMFKELIYDQFYNKNSNEGEFLLFWEKNKESIHVPSHGEINSIKILTIHKSKGLEFPVVIYPFLDSLTHRTRGLKKWFAVNDKEGSAKLLTPFNESSKEYNSSFQEEHENTTVNQELDNVNLLYVSLTRAVDELHLIPVYPKASSIDSHNRMIRFFLNESECWEEEQLEYSWGTEVLRQKSPNIKLKKTRGFRAKSLKVSPNLMFVNQKIDFGNAFHYFMSKILNLSDYQKEIEALERSDFVEDEMKKQIISLSKQVISHPLLEKYFYNSISAMCEQEIFVGKKKPVRPDRVVFFENKKIVIIDYKTGEKNKKDENQIKNYGQILSKMGFIVQKTILIYVSSRHNNIELVFNK